MGRTQQFAVDAGPGHSWSALVELDRDHQLWSGEVKAAIWRRMDRPRMNLLVHQGCLGQVWVHLRITSRLAVVHRWNWWTRLGAAAQALKPKPLPEWSAALWWPDRWRTVRSPRPGHAGATPPQ